MYFCVVLCTVCFVSFSVLFVCICVLNYCHRVANQLQLNIYHTNYKKKNLQKMLNIAVGWRQHGVHEALHRQTTLLYQKSIQSLMSARCWLFMWRGKKKKKKKTISGNDLGTVVIWPAVTRIAYCPIPNAVAISTPTQDTLMTWYLINKGETLPSNIRHSTDWK
jgi:hypothetical protein